jgi:HK97 family phage major capsid protein
MTRLEKAKQKHAAAKAQLDTLLDEIDARDENAGVITDDDQKKITDLRGQLKAAWERVELEQEAREADLNAKAVASVPGNGMGQPRVHGVRLRADDDPRRGFTNHREFLLSVITAYKEDQVDERLQPLAQMDAEGPAYLMPAAWNPSMFAAAGSDEQGFYDDQYGGFLKPVQVLPGLRSVGFDGDPTMGRVTTVPMSAPTVKINARVDKNHSTSVSGGLVVTRTPETVEFGSSRMAMEQIVLDATALTGLAHASELLLSVSPISFAALLEAGFRDQFGAHVFKEKIRGGGGDEYIGVINSGAAISVTRDGSNAIRGADVTAMYKRQWGKDRSIWIANHDTYDQITRLGAALFDTGATPLDGAAVIFRPSLGPGLPNMLQGLPIFFSEFASALGSLGDIMLVDWSQFLEGILQPLQSAESVHVRFVNHERTFKFWVYNAGAPWWRTALTPDQSTETLSPIVLLAA